MPDESLITSSGTALAKPHLLETGTVAVVGGSGFVGGAVAARLGGVGLDVRTLAAPRVNYLLRRGRIGRIPKVSHETLVGNLAERLAGARVVINAAGIAYGNSPSSPMLYGANVLMPVLVARAAARAGAHRFIHLSSAAAQGHLDLDESERTDPFSPYSFSKALGERALLNEASPTTVIFRSTWVHDVGRPNTLSLVRLARSGMACVAGDGNRPTPQVLIDDIADSVSFLARTSASPPRIVTQPSNGMTTAQVLHLLGGREPRHISEAVARTMIPAIRAGERAGVRANSIARRVEMLLFGKPHRVAGWLHEQGVTPHVDREQWTRLAPTPLPR
jgi:UDP-glucose 4-epimerase